MSASPSLSISSSVRTPKFATNSQRDHMRPTRPLPDLLKPDTPSPERLALVWKTPLEAFRSPAWSGLGNYKFLAVMLVAVMIALYIVFN